MVNALALKSKRNRFRLLVGLLVLSTVASAQTRLYVSTQGTNPNPATATSWQTATADFQGAIDALASAGGEVWVAQGTYKPTTGTDRNRSFSLKNGVKVYGGFQGNETNLMDRPALNLSTPSSTTLSGDIGTENDASDNAYHVISNTSVDNTALLDGFVITGGNATESYASGGGMYNVSSSPTVTNCSFTSNTAKWGGGMSNSWASPILTHCSFSNNRAEYGGGMENYNSNPSLTNCSLRGNTATYGGGIYIDNASSPSLTNCSIASNTATYGGGIYIFAPSSRAILTNCILWGNGNNPVFSVTEKLLTAHYCLFDAQITDYAGDNNITSETAPFLSTTDLQLTMCSPAINAGDPTSATALSGPYSATALPATDLAGYPRIQGSRVDIGAYEFQAPEPGSITVTALAASTSSCVGQPISLSATATSTGGGPVTYHWTAPEGAQLSDTTTNPISASLTTTGPQAFTVTATSMGCSATSTVSITGIAKPVPPNLTSTTIAQGTALLLTASNCTGTHSWNGPGSSSGTGPIPVNTTTPGAFAYQATCSSDACTSEPSHFTITVMAPTVTGSFEGYLYGADCQTFRGWVWDRNKANTPITVDLLDNEQLIASLPADVFRQDLLEAGKGNGCHAFVWAIPDQLKDGLPHQLSARVAGNSFVLKNAPKAILCQPNPLPGNQPPKPPTPTSLIKPLSARVGVPFQVTLPPFADPESQTLTYSQSGLPTSLTLNAQTRVLAGTPTQTGEFLITYIATDPLGAANSVSFLLTITPAVAVTGNFEGFLDKVECGTIRGWAWDRNQPNSPLTVEFYTGSTVWGTTLADIYRVDLKNAGKGNGAHAYSFPVPQELKGTGTNLI
ncbi:choice-of-anchor Q domain-containing protein [Larkinella bovis]|uniref:Choice-of-anchor Q domain-containing protein n=1 Tax=Larkinella bovis TaxID=683041 RepID=A0ABW0IA06_9BACT